MPDPVYVEPLPCARSCSPALTMILPRFTPTLWPSCWNLHPFAGSQGSCWSGPCSPPNHSFPSISSSSPTMLLVSFQVRRVHTPHSLCRNTCPSSPGCLLTTRLDSPFLGKGNWNRQNPPKVQRASTLIISKREKETNKKQFIIYTHTYTKRRHIIRLIVVISK